jgi:hypothetical protein
MPLRAFPTLHYNNTRILFKVYALRGAIFMFIFSFALMQKHSRRIGMFQKNQGQPNRSSCLSSQRHQTTPLNSDVFSLVKRKTFWESAFRIKTRKSTFLVMRLKISGRVFYWCTWGILDFLQQIRKFNSLISIKKDDEKARCDKNI